MSKTPPLSYKHWAKSKNCHKAHNLEDWMLAARILKDSEQGDLKAAAKIFTKSTLRAQHPRNQWPIQLLDLKWETNNFEFNGLYFIQKAGTSLGAAPSVSNNFMGT